MEPRCKFLQRFPPGLVYIAVWANDCECLLNVSGTSRVCWAVDFKVITSTSYTHQHFCEPIIMSWSNCGNWFPECCISFHVSVRSMESNPALFPSSDPEIIAAPFFPVKMMTPWWAHCYSAVFSSSCLSSLFSYILLNKIWNGKKQSAKQNLYNLLFTVCSTANWIYLLMGVKEIPQLEMADIGAGLCLDLWRHQEFQSPY